MREAVMRAFSDVGTYGSSMLRSHPPEGPLKIESSRCIRAEEDEVDFADCEGVLRVELLELRCETVRDEAWTAHGGQLRSDGATSGVDGFG